MALSLPTSEDLDAYKAGVDNATALQIASDLFTMATGIDTAPTDPFQERLIHNAILDMAWFLQEDHENKEAQFSPFSSERIGSYSYTKAAKAIQTQTSTGVSAFDLAVEYFKGLGPSVITMDSEWVFAKGYNRSIYDPAVSQDPSGTVVPNTDPILVSELVSIQNDDGDDMRIDEWGFPLLEVDNG